LEWDNRPTICTRSEGARALNRIGLFYGLLISLLAIDQGVKAWVRGSLSIEQSTDGPWPGVFEIKYVINKGIAFGLFPGMGGLLAPIAVIIAIFAIGYVHRHRRESVWMYIAMALLAAGALGNLYDRVFLEGVTDMFWLRIIDFPVFNVADACITVATAILILRWGYEAVAKPAPVVPEPSTHSPLQESAEAEKETLAEAHVPPDFDETRHDANESSA
jgi:signal peptidase II